MKTHTPRSAQRTRILEGNTEAPHQHLLRFTIPLRTRTMRQSTRGIIPLARPALNRFPVFIGIAVTAGHVVAFIAFLFVVVDDVAVGAEEGDCGG